MSTPNNALRRTRVRPAGGRSPLSFETLGVIRHDMGNWDFVLRYGEHAASWLTEKGLTGNTLYVDRGENVVG